MKKGILLPKLFFFFFPDNMKLVFRDFRSGSLQTSKAMIDNDYSGCTVT